MSHWSDIVAGLLLIAGAGFTLIAGLGVARMRDVFLRMHAATKAGTMGVGLTALGLIVHSGTTLVSGKALAILAFMITTAPIGAHLVGRAVYRSMSESEREACRPDDDPED